MNKERGWRRWELWLNDLQLSMWFAIDLMRPVMHCQSKFLCKVVVGMGWKVRMKEKGRQWVRGRDLSWDDKMISPVSNKQRKDCRSYIKDSDWTFHHQGRNCEGVVTRFKRIKAEHHAKWTQRANHWTALGSYNSIGSIE